MRVHISMYIYIYIFQWDDLFVRLHWQGKMTYSKTFLSICNRNNIGKNITSPRWISTIDKNSHTFFNQQIPLPPRSMGRVKIRSCLAEVASPSFLKNWELRWRNSFFFFKRKRRWFSITKRYSLSIYPDEIWINK